MIFKYTFDDGTVLKLLDIGLSVAEIWKLEELHGKCRMKARIKNEILIIKNPCYMYLLTESLNRKELLKMILLLIGEYFRESEE